jgi:hypothetical protein
LMASSITVEGAPHTSKKGSNAEAAKLMLRKLSERR